MCRTEDSNVKYAPLWIHSFRLLAPRKLVEAQLFHQRHQRYEEIQTVSERLRWCRHYMGLMQNCEKNREVSKQS